MAQLRDLSPIAGAINWAKQIERQLNMYMKRVEDVLGKGWELYAEGAKLASESSSFKRKLDTRPIYEAWLHEINRRDLQISGRLFDVQRTRNTAVHQSHHSQVRPNGLGLTNGTVDDHDDQEKQNDGFSYALAINFDPQIITLFKEVRNLLWLGFSVPHAIGNVAKDAKRVYPHAVSLVSGCWHYDCRECLRT
jgi:dynein heavy chain 1